MPRHPESLRTAFQSLGESLLSLVARRRRGRPAGPPARTELTYPGGLRRVVLDMRGPDGIAFRAIETGRIPEPRPAPVAAARMRRSA